MRTIVNAMLQVNHSDVREIMAERKNPTTRIRILRRWETARR